jgi:Uma2 family endonuclease
MREPPSNRVVLLSPEEYLARERAGRIRHEYVGGQVYAMSPVSKRHSTIALNISRKLFDATSAKGCQLFVDVLTYVAHDRYYYPDVVITCDANDHDEDVVHSPCFVVEITSPSTRATDLREKAPAYRACSSIQGFAIVEQKRQRVIAYRRSSAGEWNGVELAGSGVVDVPCIDTPLSLDEIYEGLDLPRMTVREDEDEYTTEEYEREWTRLDALRL